MGLENETSAQKAGPVRVLQVLGALGQGGPETMVMNYYRHMDPQVVQFDFVKHTKRTCLYEEEIQALGGRIFVVPRYEGMNHGMYVKAWEELFRSHPEYRIIHGHSRSTASIYLKIAAKIGLKTIAHSHNTSSGKGFSALAKDILQLPLRDTADYLFACSNAAGEWLYGKKALEGDNYRVIRNAIEIEKHLFDKTIRDPMRKLMGLEDRFILGHVGPIEHQKNHKFLLEIFYEVQKHRKNSVLVLMGGGKLKEQVVAQAIGLGIRDKVIFTGIVPNVRDYLQAMDVFVLPSFFEGLGMVVVEAQAAGLRCVVADTVPREATVTDLVDSLPLSAGAGVWAQQILKYCEGYPRRNTREELERAGYNIAAQARLLQDFYLSIYEPA